MASKFVISKGIPNEFIFTIKQNGSTLGMVINAAGTVEKSTAITPSVVYVPYTPEVQAVEAKAAVSYDPGQPFIATIAKVPEMYKMTIGSLPTVDTTLEVYINDTKFTYSYIVATTGVTTYKVLAAFKNAISAWATTTTNSVTITKTAGVIAKPTNLSTSLDYNNLFISADMSYTVNTDGGFSVYLTELSSYIAPITGQAYIAPTEAQDAVDAVDYQEAIPAHYEATNEDIILDVSNLISSTADVTKVQLKFSSAVAKVAVGATTYTENAGWYDVGVNTVVTITPITVVGNLNSVLGSISVDVIFTVAGGSDVFTFYLYKRSDDSLVTTITNTVSVDGQVSVYDKNNGKIKVTLTDALVSRLAKSVGAQVDDYYLKANYRAAIDCITTNNGNFVAKIPKVYVE